MFYNSGLRIGRIHLICRALQSPIVLRVSAHIAGGRRRTDTAYARITGALPRELRGLHLQVVGRKTRRGGWLAGRETDGLVRLCDLLRLTHGTNSLPSAVARRTPHGTGGAAENRPEGRIVSRNAR